MTKRPRSNWTGPVPATDPWGHPIVDEFYDGRIAITGQWAIMSPHMWRARGVGRLGTGYGQHYIREDGVWKQVED